MFAVAPLARRAAGARSSRLALAAAGRRNLSLHEYQSLGVFQDFGVAIPKIAVAFSPEEAAQKAKDFDGDEVVIKTQVLAAEASATSRRTTFRVASTSSRRARPRSSPKRCWARP